jgi:hypothetical protein
LALPLTMTARAASSRSGPGVSPIAARAASALTLVTGDQVRLAGTATKHAVLIRPAAKSGPGRVLGTHRIGSDVYVIPAVAEPYLGRFLDPRLFDVTQQLAAPKPSGRLPVRVSYTGSAKPAVPGVTITSAAKGVAEGYLTPTTAPAFGAALTNQWKADSRAKWPKRSTLFTGVTKISSTLPGGSTVTPNYPMYTLVIKAIGADGQPVADGFGALMNVDSGAKYNSLIEIVDGEARVSVPKGTYSLVTDDFTYTEAGQISALRLTTITQYKVTGAGQTLTVDQRAATQQLTVTAPQPAEQQAYTFEWDRTDATGDSSMGAGYTLDDSSQFFVAPAGPATIGTVVFTQGWHLTAPGAAPAYTYDLATLGNRIPAQTNTTFTTADLAAVSASYYGDNKSRDGGTVRYPYFPGTYGSGGTYQRVPLGTERIEYVGAKGGTPFWTDGAVQNYDSPDDPGFMDTFWRKLLPGNNYKQIWYRGPLGAGIPSQPAGDGYCEACRSATLLAIRVIPLTDSSPLHAGNVLGAEDGLPVGRFRFYKNGKKIYDHDDYIGGEFTVSTTKATYKAVLDVDRRLQEPNQSTSSRTELTFASGNGPGGKLPKSWFCSAGSTEECRALPVLQAKAALPVSLNGTLPAGKSTITVTAARIQYAPASAPATATFEFRPAGWSWTSVKLTSIGGGKYTGVIDNTDFAGANVDVRIGATDKGGSTYTQTVLRAYTVAGS